MDRNTSHPTTAHGFTRARSRTGAAAAAIIAQAGCGCGACGCGGGPWPSSCGVTAEGGHPPRRSDGHTNRAAPGRSPARSHRGRIDNSAAQQATATERAKSAHGKATSTKKSRPTWRAGLARSSPFSPPPSRAFQFQPPFRSSSSRLASVFSAPDCEVRDQLLLERGSGAGDLGLGARFVLAVKSRFGLALPLCRFKNLEMARFQARSDQRSAADDVGPENFTDHLKNTLSSGDMELPEEGARAPKARKPYTISKQREKWTEDEHKRFLEALQQHGRAWRRIQEHIGNKTAVQIRSHAQKFFSKVIRESSGDSNTAAPPQIQIPPPRPKRKPAHPYPRNLGSVVGKDASAIKRLEKPQLQIQSQSETENYSPKSVLTTAQISSETLAIEGSGSPASSDYMEGKCLTPSTSVGELGVQVVLSKDATATSDGAACRIPEGPVLRLFGKRVEVNNLHQQPISNTGKLQHASDMELDASAETPTSGTGKFSSHDAAEAKAWNPWLAGKQQFMCYFPQWEVLPVPSNCQFLSYGNGSISYTVLDPQTVASNTQQNHPSQAANCNAEGSRTESITTSSSLPEVTTQKSDSVESTQVNNDDDKLIPVPGSRKRVSTLPACLRGFVPYKKCTAQSKMLQSQATGDEADREMTRLLKLVKQPSTNGGEYGSSAIKDLPRCLTSVKEIGREHDILLGAGQWARLHDPSGSSESRPSFSNLDKDYSAIQELQKIERIRTANVSA
ncbi:hypothetical protein U9M48_033581 [Paspalum notatum var. saurae]|uniref:Uncharacterized protein n=1 Tax=Paspalum notatum var. saurae TaxID=547442 RepID=A0AAQ3X6Q5_PASNO